MDITMFNKPTTHPLNTFRDYNIESFMVWFLNQCIKMHNINAVITTKYNQDNLVEKGLLKKIGERQYSLTVKSKGLLYSVYGKG